MNRHRVTAARPLVRRTLGGCFLVTALILVQLQPGVPPARAAADADGLAFFDARVRPVLEANCFKCHGRDPAKLKGELQLNNRDGILRGGELGPAVDLQNPDRSLLLKMISYADDEHQMPPKGKLAPGDLEILTRWVKAGVPWKEGYGAALIERKGHGSPQVNETTRNHWAYRPLVRPTVPKVR
ncbi:MAG: hypothetical protein OER86_10620, partial [Phycisphaerae bacterium]|nr:hypothetical protein [Phycisphaerae bacterium]